MRGGTFPEPVLPHYRSVARWPGDTSVPELTIIVPAFQESERLPLGLPRLREWVAERSWELILVDDRSSDASVSVAVDLMTGLARGQVLQLERHSGKGAAVRAGVAEAAGSKIMFMDADMATELDHLPALVSQLDAHPVVIGSRTAPGAVSMVSPARDRLSRGFRSVCRRATGLNLSDFQCGFKGFRAPVAKTIFHLASEPGWAFDVEILLLASRLGASIHDMPVHWSAVQGSHIRPLSDAVRMLTDVIGITRTIDRTPPIYVLDFEAEGAGRAAVGTLGGPAGNAIAVDDGGVTLVLLPFAGAATARQMQQRLRRRLSGVDVGLRKLRLEDWMSPSMVRARAALVDLEVR